MNNYGVNESHATLIALAMDEDLGSHGDLTANSLIDANETSRVVLRTRQRGVLSGVEVATETLHTYDPTIEVSWSKHEGDICEAGEILATMAGSLRSLLAAERTTLNFLQHLSGIATLTRIFVDELAKIHSTTIVRDTRKTLPGYRTLEKRAVVSGGGRNHRMGLYDAFLIKDNHLMGTSLESSIDICREKHPDMPIEVEVDNLDQLNLVLSHRPDLVMLDNFSVEDVLEAIRRSPMTDFEISGGITFHNLASYGATNVKYIAIGALTHSAPALDMGFDAR